MDIIAKLHPALVHLPIGFILLSILVDIYQHRNQIKNDLSFWTWMASSLSSLLALATGFLLLNTGHYEGLSTFLHWIGGVVISILSVVMTLARWKNIKLFDYQDLVVHSLLTITLMITGHLGGEMTHGKEYLAFNTQQNKEIEKATLDPDSVKIYADLIQPLFNRYCTKCHEPGDARGQLDMTTIKGLQSAVFGDPAIQPYDLENSAAYRRVVLAQHDTKHMPPSGEPMSFEEIRLLQWWILEGGSFEENVSDVHVPTDVSTILTGQYGIQFLDNDSQISSDLTPLTESELSSYSNLGFNIEAIAPDHPLLEVDRFGMTTPLRKEELDKLSEISDYIYSMDLRESVCDDDMLETIGQFSALRSLSLQNTRISDLGITHFEELQNLSMLNVYGTSLSDNSIPSLSKLTSLQEIYIYDTKITEQGIKELEDQVNGVSVIGRQTLKPSM